MKEKKHILAIDQGTSSTKTLLVDEQGVVVVKGTAPLATHYHDNGFVEQDPVAIIENVIASVKLCLLQAELKGIPGSAISCIGISNQRETFVLWDEKGEPLHNAIVWQCKRSVSICEELVQRGLSEIIRKKTGLVVDPYFSASKIIWLMRHQPELKTALQNKSVYFGTVDSWLLFRLTQGKNYATDHTNASRTMLFNLHDLSWDEELIAAFGLSGIQLPAVQPSSSYFGETTLDGLLPAPVPITAMVGDSHAAAFGEGCFETGTAKATMGTGCSILMNIGEKPVASANGMVTTICWSTREKMAYALEGVIVSCGATIEWLKNSLHLFSDSAATEAMANSIPDNGGVYLVPAFSGLGSPHWQMDRKASITGLNFGSSDRHIVRAGLESIAYQIKDVVSAMENDTQVPLRELNTDGGLTSNGFLMQFLADLLQKKIVRTDVQEISALGVAKLAGLLQGIFPDFGSLKRLAQTGIRFDPVLDNATADKAYNGWLKAIAG